MAYEGANLFAMGFISGLWILYNGIKKYKLLQKIKNAPTSKVQSAAVGLVKLYGTVEPMECQLSPISKKSCAYWIITGEYKINFIDRINNLYNGHRSWRPICTIMSGNQFYLKDKTGKMIVDPNFAEVEIQISNTYTGCITGKGLFGESHKKIDESALTFINSLSDESKKRFKTHKKGYIRILEYCIAEKDSIYVLGDAEIREDIHSLVGHENLIVRKGKHDKIMYIGNSPDLKIIQSLTSSFKWNLGIGLVLSSVSLLLLLLIFLI
ncbi:hypothetical protein KKF81_06595 [Candidatus Micrarchaeota archaeon]|nr:hypothetical protein [Candidatus Micrarchaeota archaeon]MBU1166597.1 hypothetical protein [Candidatus Micrarchaeota archaeon]MBU1887271.1 hypothetical protein [Candidatus Micrarchaeota archaeon]